MSILSPTGILNPRDNIVYPSDTSTWSTIPATWDAWSTWAYTPANPLVWITDLLDMGEISDFNLRILTDAQGLVEYTVYVSSTGEFNGEENSYDIVQDQSGIAAFSGRYVLIAVKVYQTSGINSLTSVEVTGTTQTVNFQLKNVDTSTLAGSNTARTLVLPRSVSKIWAMDVTPHELATAYTLDLYVSSTQTSKQLVPRVVSKTNTPQIALYGLDNQPRDGTVDVFITALPEQYMSQNNLLNR